MGGFFDCSHNRLINLIGSPSEVGGNYICVYNELVSLKGVGEVGGYFDSKRGNYAIPMEIYSKDSYYLNDIIKYQDDYSIWNSDNSLNEYRFKEMIDEIKEIKK